MTRRTIIVADRIAADAMRLRLAREGAHGVDVRTVPQVAARLAGGFLRPIDPDALADAAAQAVRQRQMPAEALGDLQAIADLPGLPGALAATLTRVWDAGIDLPSRAAARPDLPRLATIARLEAAVLAILPPTMLRPCDLTRRAMQRFERIGAVLGGSNWRQCSTCHRAGGRCSAF